MDILYKNKTLERFLVAINMIVTAIVTVAALAQLGFYQPIISENTLLLIFGLSALVFISEKSIRFFNAQSKKQYIRVRWFEMIFVILLLILLYYATPIIALSVYLLLQIITKICKNLVNLAASGQNPARALIGSFLILIICGTVLLMLPRCWTVKPVGLVDALFTATSASCVTGLVVKNTGVDFTIAGQTVILVLIQLGGLGIVIFGAVFALLFGQALNVRQSVAMQDLLNAQTVGRITNVIAFIFISTIAIETIGAVTMLGAFETAHPDHKWFYAIFHSVSAFCNAGFALYNDSLIKFKNSPAVYSTICFLIIVGGLGFGVLYNLINVFTSRVKRIFIRIYKPKQLFYNNTSVPIQLQTKIVLTVSTILLFAGAVLLAVMQKQTGPETLSVADAFFQSVTARTAGFNTVDIASLSAPAKAIMMILMFIGGSPGSTAGGIKTVTLVVIIMAVYSTIRKRREVEIFKRSIPLVIVGKALTVVFIFIVVLFISVFMLTITERHNGFDSGDIMFEASSALGTVGLSCGITNQLSTAGKIIIIITMLIGRLGPLTMLALLTFNIKPAKFDYPTESVVVG